MFAGYRPRGGHDVTACVMTSAECNMTSAECDVTSGVSTATSRTVSYLGLELMDGC